jgi:hypothetical protein
MVLAPIEHTQIVVRNNEGASPRQVHGNRQPAAGAGRRQFQVLDVALCASGLRDSAYTVARLRRRKSDF